MTKKKSILIIEEETNLANGLKRILEREGYSAIPAFSPYHLKELDKHLDLAIVNINIPKEFGLSMLRKIKKAFPSLPIIAMTVYSNSFTKNELNRLGANDFIAKPFDIRCLKKRIEELIGSKG